MIVDANVLVSAVLGRSAPLLTQACERGLDLVVPHHQVAEARGVLRRVVTGQVDEALMKLGDLLEQVTVVPLSRYARLEENARARLYDGGQSDWPVLALALASSDDVWSNDADFFGTGVAVWSTRNIAHAQADEMEF